MTAPQFDYSNIPPELQARRQWVLWGVDPDNPKAPRQVVSPTQGAKANNPMTWGSFEPARCIVDTDAAKAADMPDGQALQSGDYALLSANFPMSAEEYQKLCERNKNNPTLLRAAIDYGNRNGGIAPYAKRYYKSAADRIKLFDEFIKRCKAVLEADPTNPARGDAYWNMIARDAEPWATL